jgi:hypothetical protein
LFSKQVRKKGKLKINIKRVDVEGEEMWNCRKKEGTN